VIENFQASEEWIDTFDQGQRQDQNDRK
jgi:hypothetical protein